MSRIAMVVLFWAMAGLSRQASAQASCSVDSCGDYSVEPSLVVRRANSEVFNIADFSIGRSLGRILATAGGQDAPAERERLLRSLLASTATTSFTHPSSGVPLPATSRSEASLDPRALLTVGGPDELIPVALFNRFDLVPESAVHCGEYRIVYALRSGAGVRRLFLIFEAALLNPVPGSLQACRPVVQFWKDLAGKSSAQQASELARFYYDGGTLGGIDFPPVVRFEHFGEPAGQVRSNMFIRGPVEPWQLREWRVARTPTRFVPHPVKDSPYRQLFDDASSAAFTQERGRFKVALTTHMFERLFFPEIGVSSAPSQCDIVNGFGSGVPDRFNGFTHDSTQTDDPAALASVGGTVFGVLERPVQALNEALPGAALTATHALNRMGAMTCGGCHQFSAGRDLGGANWPRPAAGGFVHVNERGDISPALLMHFLPNRQCIASNYLSKTPPPAPEEGAGLADASAVTSQGSGRSSRTLELFRDVRVRAQALGDGGLGDTGSGGSGDALIRQARESEQSEPGAVVKVRRPHG